MAVRGLAALVPLAALLVTGALLRRRGPALALAGLASLAWVALAPSLSPDAVGVPIVLMGLAVVGDGAEVGRDSERSQEEEQSINRGF